ncbi:MAG: alpha/beta hydrolase [Myxococcales bacterium]|nr:alpha/beta hydrolase [Myxococcales bacterium]
MQRRLIVVPRWGGTPRSDFYPWLAARLAGRPDIFEDVYVCDLPEPGTPRIDTWPPAISRALADGLVGETFVLAHSVGCQAAMHAIAALPEGVTIAGMLAVAGWWTVDRPWPTIVPWIEQGPDLARVRAVCPRISVLLSDDDPFTADAAANAALWRERLAAEVTLAPGAKHFNDSEEPAVLTALGRLVGAALG